MKQNNEIKVLYGGEASERMEGQDTRLLEFILSFPSVRQRLNALLTDQQRESIIEGYMQRERVAFREGRSAVATMDGEVVAKATHESIGVWNDGRPVYEIGGVVTLEDERFRGKHLSSLVQDRCMQEVILQDPLALFLVVTSNLSLIARYSQWGHEKLGLCTEIGVEGWTQILRRRNGVSKSMTTAEIMRVRKQYPDHRSFLIDMRQGKKQEVQQ